MKLGEKKSKHLLLIMAGSERGENLSAFAVVICLRLIQFWIAKHTGQKGIAAP